MVNKNHKDDQGLPLHQDGVGQKPASQGPWSAFAGRHENPLNKVVKVGSIAPSTGLNVANYAAAARARTASNKSNNQAGDDALADFRASGAWEAKEVLNDFARPVESQGKRPTRRRDQDPEALILAAKTLVGISFWGKDKGVRDLCSATRGSEHLSDEQRRKVEGIGRAAGNRTLSIEMLRELVPLLCAASGSREQGIMERLDYLLGTRSNVRVVGDESQHKVKPRQFLDLRRFEAYLIIADFPEGRAAQGRRGPQFERVLGLLRDVKKELYLIDIKGLHDPVEGKDDSDTFIARMRKPDEMALGEFMGGLRREPPNSPIARITWNGYLQTSLPDNFSGISLSVIKGAAFRYM